ncbi:hypothetical protein [Mesorhizobium sp.]|uniref:hypothetical protein n=1 Tax=Mesorhizobium sp. TaxID=1871066 RepID=UPI000FE98D1B|nr:hypothetical protein [Mesorhizobium sp.]RWA81174.1 MAG: hypothetical protein EOQ32_30610 [Mesorhizobium sp.]
MGEHYDEATENVGRQHSTVRQIRARSFIVAAQAGRHLFNAFEDPVSPGALLDRDLPRSAARLLEKIEIGLLTEFLDYHGV